MVGTTVKNVMGRLCLSAEWGRNGAANRFQTVSALNGKRNSTVEPAKSGVIRAFTVPCMWWRGRTWRSKSDDVYRHALISERAWAVRTDMFRTTPFCQLDQQQFASIVQKLLTGRLVVPDVYSMKPPLFSVIASSLIFSADSALASIFSHTFSIGLCS